MGVVQLDWLLFGQLTSEKKNAPKAYKRHLPSTELWNRLNYPFDRWRFPNALVPDSALIAEMIATSNFRYLYGAHSPLFRFHHNCIPPTLAPALDLL